MNTSESFAALRRANPRAGAGFARSVDAAAEAIRAQIDTAVPRVARRSYSRRRLLSLGAAAASLAAAAAVAAFLTVGSQGPGVEDAVAAVRKAAMVSAASAERSGTAVVRITHNGELWAGKTIRWNDGNLALSSEHSGRRGKVGAEFLLVDGTMYGIDEGDCGWVDMGSPDSIDPGSGTTPAEYLAAAREDVGGATLRRFGTLRGLTANRLDEGSTVYAGRVAAALIARKAGLKQGQRLRLLPFGYVAHDDAADPAALLDAAVTVGADGLVREIAVSWEAWTYTVTYRSLGATAAITAPASARPLRERLRSGDR